VGGGVACLLWLVLAVALSPTLLDWFEHLVAEPRARYAALFVPLLLHLAWVRPSSEPRRALALLVVIAAVSFAFLAVGGGVTRMGRLALPFAVLGMAAWLGRPGPAVVGLAFFAIPVPHGVVNKVGKLLEVLPQTTLVLEPADMGLGLAALLAGFGYHSAVVCGGGVLPGMRRACIQSLYALPLQGALLLGALGLAASGQEPVARATLTHAPFALGVAMLASQKLKERNDASTLRVQIESDSTVIMKLWKRPGIAGHLRRATGTDPGGRESRALARLLEAGIAVPAPLGTASFVLAESEFTDALFLEDLGSCETAFEHLKSLIRMGEEARVERFLGEVVEMTAAIVERDIIDTDHSLNNLVVTARGELVRLDTEVARQLSGRPARPYGSMLGRLIGTFIFAVQPDLERVGPFARALVERLDPEPAVLLEASAQVARMLEGQRCNRSLDTRVTLPWDELDPDGPAGC
jgi:tRNA A-37 threonylcarbamoyl transferase component Bud32